MANNVLIVEDNDDTREIFSLTLSSFQVKAACSRDQALQIIQSGFKPACIVMDYMMPGMPLQDFLKEMKPFKQRVILLSGVHDAKATADMAGIAVSLQKPVPSDMLVRVVEKVAGVG